MNDLGTDPGRAEPRANIAQIHGAVPADPVDAVALRTPGSLEGFVASLASIGFLSRTMRQLTCRLKDQSQSAKRNHDRGGS